MAPIWIAIALIFAALAAIFGVFFRGLLARRSRRPPTLDWVRTVSVARYRPMERLLTEEDCRFVRAFPGAGEPLVRQLRSERRRIFRAYLRSMQRDFHGICAALRAMMVLAPADRSELATTVFKHQVAFQLAVARVEFGLVLHAAGVDGVDVSALFGCFDKLRLELHAMLPAPAPMAA
jgi:hypothetical protein